MYEHWERVPIFGDRIRERFKQGKQEGWKEGREEGREEGQTLALQDSIMDVLATRFTKENGKIARLVNSIDDPKKLRTIFRRTLKAQSLDVVVDMLQKAKPAPRLARRGRKTSKSIN